MWHVEEASHTQQAEESEDQASPTQQNQEPEERANQTQQSQDQEPEEKTVQPVVATAPQFGRTNRRIFWSVFLAAFLVLATLTAMVAEGTVAVATSLPTPFTLQGSTFILHNVRIIPGISRAGRIPVAVVQADATVENLVLSKQFSVPFIGTVTIFFKASSATLKGLVLDQESLFASHALFNNLVIRTDIPPGLEVTTPFGVLTNVTIKSPFLSVNTAQFTNFSVFLTP